MAKKSKLNRAEKEKYLLLLEEKFKRESRKNLLRFTQYTMPNFAPAEFHKRYYQKLTDFIDGKIKKLMIFMPPQHGKSEGSTRRTPSLAIGRNPNKKIAIICYSSAKARKFNREIKRIICGLEYQKLFGNIRLATGKKEDVGYTSSSDEFEVVGYTGSVKTVGVGGGLTGEPVDMLIMDDLYKDAKTAWSPTIREAVADWYDTVASARLHNDSQQLIVFTRWHEEDLAGRLIEEDGLFSEDNPQGWVVLTYQAIKEGKPSQDDPRQEGEALWEEKHSREKLLATQRRNPHVFESLYQQNPKPQEGLMYERFDEYDIIPIAKRRTIKAYVDTADTGSDYLCAIIYVETETANYIIDILYTQKPMEYTETKLAQMLSYHNVDICVVESNNGGRGFARKVEENCRLMNNNNTKFSWLNQRENKAVRIFTHSASVQNLTKMPHGWERRFREFHKDITHYLKNGKNAHDDAPDCLTGTIEQRSQNGQKASDLVGYF